MCKNFSADNIPFFLIFVMVFLLILTRCQGINDTGYSIKVIDSCEYICSDVRPTILTHKGNCKYCIERNKNK